MQTEFHYNNFFDITHYPHKAIFESTVYIWESLGRLKGYMDDIFHRGTIKTNFSKAPLVFIGKGTIIDEGVKIEGPVIIGENCVIKHGAFLREYCLLGNSVTIGHGSEIKHSIFLNNSSAAHLNYVGDSIVGNQVNLGGGVITANVRLDKQPVRISIKNQKIETGLKKLGAIIGDESSIGVNSVLNPGTILGKRNIVYPLTSVVGMHDDDQTIK